ncbi:MAG: class I SAM-dependent methyltransferase [Phycisphaerae bacterium]|nr:class I SAM-dependent methyltransferase [Phycisphaerae bacterium]
MTRKSTKARRGWRTAATSDRHELYELAVQNVDFECSFIDRVMKTHRSRLPRTLREDFCGTFAASVGWVQHRKTNTAIAVDLDPSVLAWGRGHNLTKLNAEQAKRLDIRNADVLKVKTPAMDVVAAWNFSYFLFKSRAALMAYFRKVHADLVSDGLFILDAYGGSEAFTEVEEERNLDGFTYIWDQNKYNPITNEVLNYIHFRFPDGTEMRKAFTYDWRLWTLPEIQEALLEVGFKKVTVYWEGTDQKTGEGNGVFRPTRTGEACAGWIAYLVAEK